MTQLAKQLAAYQERGIAVVPQPYVCPSCQKAFGSSRELNGHISGHKQKGEWLPDQYGDWEGRIEANIAFLEAQAKRSAAA